MRCSMPSFLEANKEQSQESGSASERVEWWAYPIDAEVLILF